MSAAPARVPSLVSPLGRAAARVRARVRLPALLRDEPLLFAAAFGASALYATYSVLRHMHYLTGHDLAIYDQAVWHYSRFEAPSTTLVNPVLGSAEHFPYQLGDHFSPILAVLGPLYWIWADARMLLMAQALIVAAAAVPIFLFTRLHVGRVSAYLFALAYLAYWGVHAAVAFDFHEVAFAPLLIACAIYFTAVERWRGVFVALALLLLVKEDMGAFVAFFGVYLLLLRRIRIGVVCLVAGTAWLMLTTKFLMPIFAGGREYRYWFYDRFGPDLPHALWTIIRDPTLPFLIATDNTTKVQTIFFLFAPFLFLALYSPLLVLAVPLIAERMLREPSLAGMSAHYSLSIAPVIAMASAEGLRNLLGHFRLARVNWLAPAVAVAIVFANLPKAYPFFLDELRGTAFYRRSELERQADEALAQVPRHDGSVATSAPLKPHLSQRSVIYAIGADTPLTDFIVYQTREPSLNAREDTSAAPDFANQLEAVAARRGRYTRIFENESFAVLELKPGSSAQPAAG